MKMSVIGLAAALLLSSNAVSQSCSTLAATGSKTEVTLKLTGGTPRTMTFLAFADKAGTTKISFGRLGTLELGLASPVMILPIGFTDAKGNLSLAVKLRPNTPEFAFKGQAVNAKLTISSGRPPKVEFKFCTSNVVDIKGGGN